MDVVNTGLSSQAWIATILTSIGVICTAVSAFSAYLVYKETKRIRKAQTEAKILVTLRSSELSSTFIMLRIENIGNSTATDVRLTVNKDINITKDRKLSDLGIFNIPFSLAPNQYYSFLAIHTIDYDDLFDTKFSITASYLDASDPIKKETKSFGFNIKIFEKMMPFTPDGVHHVSKHLEKISKSTERLVHFDGRVHVRNFSDKDIRQKELEFYQEQIKGSDQESD